jgi:hypothetical protein
MATAGCVLDPKDMDINKFKVYALRIRDADADAKCYTMPIGSVILHVQLVSCSRRLRSQK